MLIRWSTTILLRQNRFFSPLSRKDQRSLDSTFLANTSRNQGKTRRKRVYYCYIYIYLHKQPEHQFLSFFFFFSLIARSDNPREREREITRVNEGETKWIRLLFPPSRSIPNLVSLSHNTSPFLHFSLPSFEIDGFFFNRRWKKKSRKTRVITWLSTPLLANDQKGKGYILDENRDGQGRERTSFTTLAKCQWRTT